ncbi:MAG: DUF7010 family protein [Pseudoalteromonas sp.]
MRSDTKILKLWPNFIDHYNWVVYSWIVKHPVGLIHAVLRSILIVAAWYLFPNSSILAISCVIVLTYLISIYQMLTRNMIRT